MWSFRVVEAVLCLFVFISVSVWVCLLSLCGRFVGLGFCEINFESLCCCSVSLRGCFFIEDVFIFALLVVMCGEVGSFESMPSLAIPLDRALIKILTRSLFN